jgi:hypothetical protein
LRNKVLPASEKKDPATPALKVPPSRELALRFDRESPCLRSSTALAAEGVFALFPASSADGDRDRIARSNHGHFESLDHQVTVTGLVQIVDGIIVDQQLFTDQFLLLESKVRNNSPFASAQQNNFFYLRFASFHKSSGVAIQLA